MARPRIKIDPDTVEKLAMVGCNMEQIGSVMGCSVDTLERRFADVIKSGRNRGCSSILKKQWDLALQGNVTMLIWIGKQRLGQKEPMRIEHAVDPNIVEATKQVDQMSKDQKIELLKEELKRLKGE